MTELPKGWALANVHELAETSLGKMLDAKQQTGEHPTPYLRNINVRWGSFDLSDIAEMDVAPHELERVLAQPGDVIACEGGEPGRAAVWRGEPIAIQKALHRMRPAVGISPDYLAYGLRAAASIKQLDRLFTGTTIKHLPQEKLRQVQIALAPTSEQERIVTAIEEAFSKLDAGEAGLRTVRQLLKRMRDAILTAAVTGRLVPQDPTDTPAAKLLADRGVERVSLGWVPVGWARATLQDLLQHTIGGVWGVDPGGDEVDVLVLRVTEMRPDGSIDAATAVRRSVRWSQLSSRQLEVGDLLLEKSGGGPARPVGRVGMVRAVPEPSVCANFMQLLRADPRVCLPSYLEMALRQFHLSGGTESLQTATTNIRNLKMKDYFATVLTVPPLEEQVRIVTEAERQLSFVDACERAVEVGLARSGGLRRSVLKAAFEGRLVPQDPSDEPATVMLERIRAERAAQPPAKRRARQTA